VVVEGVVEEDEGGADVVPAINVDNGPGRA